MSAVSSANQIKIFGKRVAGSSPVECHHRALAIWRQMERLNPYPRPRGFIVKARTRQEYEEWRKAQTNPRFW